MLLGQPLVASDNEGGTGEAILPAVAAQQTEARLAVLGSPWPMADRNSTEAANLRGDMWLEINYM